MVIKVEVRQEDLMEFLDKYMDGELYPKLGEDDKVIRVNINRVTAEFILAEKT